MSVHEPQLEGLKAYSTITQLAGGYVAVNGYVKVTVYS